MYPTEVLEMFTFSKSDIFFQISPVTKATRAAHIKRINCCDNLGFASIFCAVFQVV